MTEPLRECPFCSGTDVAVVRLERGALEWWIVGCGGCQTSGPLCISAEQASWFWNRASRRTPDDV
jgi:hypothetical protein